MRKIQSTCASLSTIFLQAAASPTEWNAYGPRTTVFEPASLEIILEEQIEFSVDWARVARLMDKHGLSRSNAVQVVQGRLCINKVLLRQRRLHHLRENRDRSIFSKAVRDGRPRVFAMHGQAILIGRVKAVRQYEVDVLPLGADLKPSGDLKTIHKLQFKFGAYFDHLPIIQRSLKVCLGTNKSCIPIDKPQDRYPIADKKLFSWIEASSPIRVKTLEGEMVNCTLSWIGRWELGLNVSGVELVLLRHALANIQGIRWDSSKAV